MLTATGVLADVLTVSTHLHRMPFLPCYFHDVNHNAVVSFTLAPSASVSALLLLCQTSQTASGRSCARHEDSNTNTDQSGASCCALIGCWDLMNCDKENTAKKMTSKGETTEQTLFTCTTTTRRGGGAVTPRRTRFEPSTERIPVFVSRHISPFHRETNWTKTWEFQRLPTRGQRSERL